MLFLFAFTFFLSSINIYIIYLIDKYFLSNEKDIEYYHSSNFDIVNAKILKTIVGKELRYKSKVYFPYIKYEYSYKGYTYISDSFSKYERYYNTNISVIKIFDFYRAKYNNEDFKVYVHKLDSNLSYIDINYNDNKIEKKLIELKDNCILLSVFSIIAFLSIEYLFIYIWHKIVQI